MKYSVIITETQSFEIIVDSPECIDEQKAEQLALVAYELGAGDCFNSNREVTVTPIEEKMYTDEISCFSYEELLDLSEVLKLMRDGRMVEWGKYKSANTIKPFTIVVNNTNTITNALNEVCEAIVARIKPE